MALPNPRFEASYERLFGGDVAMAGRGDVFFRAFYRRFLGLPEVARLFAGVDMARQVEMLRKSLFILASYYVLGEVSPELKRIAAVHQRIGLSSRMFDDWMRCLLDTVAEFVRREGSCVDLDDVALRVDEHRGRHRGDAELGRQVGVGVQVLLEAEA